jgi:hypothetical protein
VTDFDHGDLARKYRVLLEQRQNPDNFVQTKSIDVRLMIAKDRLDVSAAAIAAADPNYFRRKAQQYAEVTEVRVFGYYYETFAACVFSHFLVRDQINAEVVNMI